MQRLRIAAASEPRPGELDSCQYGDYVAVKIRYPDCTNYEGVKILVFRSTVQSVRAQRRIDPHFGRGDLTYPIARFQPTAEGWQDALAYAESKNDRPPGGRP